LIFADKRIIFVSNMSRHKVNVFVADAYREAQIAAQTLMHDALPKAVISVTTVEHGGDLALSATVESSGPYPQTEIAEWVDCVRSEITVNWVGVPEDPSAKL
jgi:hypothetical protein